MGIDWFRMRPKRNINEGELASLIALQAEAFQGLPSMWSTDQIEPYETGDEETARRLERQYGDASRALKELLDFPTYDHETESATDYPDLVVCWRVYPITHNSIFPLPWRVQAHRTILPQSLEHQLGVWKEWITAVAQGKHQPFLLDLYLYETTIRLNMLYPDLRRVAQESLSKTGQWASKPDLGAVRDQILSFQVPAIHPAPTFPSVAFHVAVNLTDHQPYQAITHKVAELVALTRAWDSKVKQNRKVRYYENYYMTFQEFLDQAKDKWLHDFLKWAEACCSHEMGLFLDY